jgi:hypothetical protein
MVCLSSPASKILLIYKWVRVNKITRVNLQQRKRIICTTLSLILYFKFYELNRINVPDIKIPLPCPAPRPRSATLVAEMSYCQLYSSCRWSRCCYSVSSRECKQKLIQLKELIISWLGFADSQQSRTHFKVCSITLKAGTTNVIILLD